MTSHWGFNLHFPKYKEIKPVNLKGDQTWIFTLRTDAEGEAPVFWSSDENRWLIWKAPDAGKDGWQKEKMVEEDEMAGQHHRCDEHDLGKLQETVRDREVWYGSMGLQRVRHYCVTEQQQIQVMLNILLHTCWPFGQFLWIKLPFWSFVHFKIWVICFSLLSCSELFTYTFFLIYFPIPCPFTVLMSSFAMKKLFYFKVVPLACILFLMLKVS